MPGFVVFRGKQSKAGDVRKGNLTILTSAIYRVKLPWRYQGTPERPIGLLAGTNSAGEYGLISSEDVEYFCLELLDHEEDPQPPTKMHLTESKVQDIRKTKKAKTVKVKVGYLVNSKCVQRMSVAVSETCNASDLLQQAIHMHRTFNGTFEQQNEYVLLFKDRTEVNYIPGTTKPFTLDEYKKASSWTYSEMRFYIAAATDAGCKDTSKTSGEGAGKAATMHPVCTVSKPKSSADDDLFQKSNYTILMEQDNTSKVPPQEQEKSSTSIPSEQSRQSNITISEPLKLSDSQPLEPIPSTSKGNCSDEEDIKEPSTSHEFDSSDDDMLPDLSTQNVPVAPVVMSKDFQYEIDIRRTRVEKSASWIVTVRRNQFMASVSSILSDEDLCDWDGDLKVRFVGEDAPDCEGPRREFFSLYFRNCQCFANGTITLYADLLDSKRYQECGRMMALATLYGHPGPRVFHKAIVGHLLMGQEPDLDVDDVSDMHVKNAIKEIKRGQPLEDTLALLEATGFRKMLTRSTAAEAVRAVIFHHLLYSKTAAFNQFIDGLRLHSVYDVLKRCPEKGAKLLQICDSVSEEDILDFFKPSFSEDQHQREREESVYIHFPKFVKKITKNRLKTNKLQDIDNIVSEGGIGEIEKHNLTVEEFLQALVGCPHLPLDIVSGLILFDHIGSELSTSNTCAPSLNLKVNSIKEYSDFENHMVNICIGAYGFGRM